jgi:Family of unknown function (DUF5994)
VTTSQSTSTDQLSKRVPLRMRIREAPATGHVDGGWWPQSRNLQVEAADLVDHFPAATGRINRLVFSRPDWDNSVVDGHGVRRIEARRGVVKVGSFPSDDTRLMILVLATGQHLRLRVIPSDASPDEAERQLAAIAAGAEDDRSAASARWDAEEPHS